MFLASKSQCKKSGVTVPRGDRPVLAEEALCSALCLVEEVMVTGLSWAAAFWGGNS